MVTGVDQLGEVRQGTAEVLYEVRVRHTSTDMVSGSQTLGLKWR